jgi:BirA family biotin operon repressor/biotin-[acetyl-CoA-carboxylase] ligase
MSRRPAKSTPPGRGQGAEQQLSSLHGSTISGGHHTFRIEYLPRVDSTQRELERRLRAGALPDGAVLLAEEQTAGRGRHGRTWVSPAGVNVYLSCHLLLDLPLTQAHRYLFAAALAAWETLARQCPQGDIWIKWPNDIWWGEAKLAGILVSTHGEREGRLQTLTGIGVNLNADPTDLPPEATSVRIAAGISVNRAAFVHELLRNLGHRATWVAHCPWQELKEEWLAAADFAHWRGVASSAVLDGKPLPPLDLGPHGELLLQNPSGEIVSITQLDPPIRIIRARTPLPDQRPSCQNTQ